MNRFGSVTRPLRWFMALLLVAFVTGCGGGNGIVLTSIAVTPATVSVPVGITQQFTAIATYNDGSSKVVTTSSSWTSGTPGKATKATINSTGLATGVAVGDSVITASFGGKTATATLTVTTATLTSIAVTPATASIPAGLTQQFTATGTYSDGLTAVVAASWTSGTPGKATVNSTGLATGVAVGTSVITASFGGKTATTTLTVTAATLTSIAVTPATASVPVGLTQQFTATGTYSDGSTAVVAASWTSATTSVATVLSTGVATGGAVGTSVITASFGGKTATANLTVTAATLTSIAVTPATASIPAGLTQQFTATGTYSDGSTAVVAASWTSATTSVATVLSTGVATGGAVGTSVITASFGGKTATANLTVTAATLTSIAVTPATASIPAGLTQQFTATGTYSDGSTAVVAASWTSATTSVATVLSTGVATGVASGTSVITASFGGKTATANLTVTAATLTSIAVTPATASVPVNGTQQFTATGTYSNGSTAVVAASWTSATTSVATVLSTGVATGIASGTSVITASFGGKTATATLTVTAAATTVLPGAGTNPTVLSSSPTDGDISVPTSSNSTIAAANNTVTGKLVTATFSAVMDPTTINEAVATTALSTFSLKEKIAGTNVPGTVTMNAANTMGHAANMVATFKPSVALTPNTSYTATVTTAAKTAANAPITQTVAWSFTTKSVALTGQEPVDLLSILTKNFVILSKTGITQAIPTLNTITGNIGVSSTTGASITVACTDLVQGPGIGQMFTDDGTPTGTCHILVPADTTTAFNAVADMGIAYLEAGGRTSTAALATNMSGLTLYPGVHTQAAGVVLNAGSVTGDPNGVTLDCLGDSNAVFIFQIAGTFTVGSGAQVTLAPAGKCQAKNIFWVVQSAATPDVPLGTSSQLKGNILAFTTIAVNTTATVNGRLLSQTAVTLNGNAVGP